MKLLLALRVLALVQAVATCLQPVLAGLYLHGTGGAIRIHEPIGLGLFGIATAGFVVATIWWRTGGRWAAPVVMLGLALGFGFQIGMGYDRQLALHLPIGLLLVGSTIGFAYWSIRSTSRSEVPA